MLYSNSQERKRRILLIAIITVLGSLFLSTKVSAESISPHSTDVTVNVGEISKHSVNLQNDKDYEIYLTPKLYKYYPKTEIVLDLEQFEEFVIIDSDYITIPPKSNVDIPFQITGLKSVEPGTYYNLIAFEPTPQSEQDQNRIGASGALSHIVKINLTNSNNQDQITDDYAVEMQVSSRGIPFYKPAKIKILIFNNSPYTLIPKGELQIVKNGQDKEPQYIKVNMDRVRVYPKDSIELEYDIDKWYVEDIIFGKTAYLRLSNGLDETEINSQIEIPGYRNELLYILATITVIILLARAIKGNDTKPEPEYAE
jgi:hypothetical protein